MEQNITDIFDFSEDEEILNYNADVFSAYYEELFDSSSSDSSKEDVVRHSKVNNFMSTAEAYSEQDFKSPFRVEKYTANYLTDMYGDSTFLPSPNIATGGRSRIGARREIYLFLWYIANTITFRQLGNLFGVAKSSSWFAVRRVCHWIISFGHNYIKWPAGNEIVKQLEVFRMKNGIPGVIGAVDCTHIRIKAPKDNKTDYFNRKRNYSIVVQDVVDSEKKFTDVYIGEPGSLHDSRVLRRSELFRKVTENESELFPHDTFLLGDSAYQSSSWIVSPFKNIGSLSSAQSQFNYIHSSTRMVVEKTFGLLKTRFRRLFFFTEQSDIPAIVNIVSSASILHIMCILWNAEFEEEDEEEPIHFEANPIDVNPGRRQILLEYLLANRIIRA